MTVVFRKQTANDVFLELDARQGHVVCMKNLSLRKCTKCYTFFRGYKTTAHNRNKNKECILCRIENSVYTDDKIKEFFRNTNCKNIKEFTNRCKKIHTTLKREKEAFDKMKGCVVSNVKHSTRF